MMLKRIMEFVVAFLLVVLLAPLLIFIAFLIKIDSKGPVFYKQLRVGFHNIDFRIIKFRTMRTGEDKSGLLTIGGRDPRITKIGYYLRKYKLDELPQLFNILNGTMSFVGPRPEVRHYVNYYSEDQKQVFNVKPGITDYASIEFANENDLLAQSLDPENVYIKEVMPAKLKLNQKYILEKGFFTDVKIIGLTIKRILMGR